MRYAPALFAATSIAALLAFPAAGQHAHDAPASPAAAAASAPADPHAGHVMPMSASPPNPAPAPSASEDHTDRVIPQMPPSAADLPIGQDTAPAPATLGAADALFGASAMNAARTTLAREHGGAFLWKVMLDKAEYRAGPDGAGFGWEGEAWFGGDFHRLVLKSEGDGTARSGIEDAEWQALYSRAIGPYTDLQFGLRQDVGDYAATYAAFGVETILPYWLKGEAALFVSTRGDALARLEGSYDFLLTQRLVLQPDLEFNFAAQDIPGALIGNGLSRITAGLRLRYDITRQFSPYIGVNFDRQIGATAKFHRAAGQEIEATSLVIGLRAFL